MDTRTPGGPAQWYDTPVGQRTAGLLGAAIKSRLPSASTTRLLAIAPAAVLDVLGLEGYERIAVIESGAGAWPRLGSNMALAADTARLPFVESMFDTVLVIHALEASDVPHAFLRELWRVLAPSAEIVLVVANRVGLWSMSKRTPFGQGQFYGRRALAEALNDAMFEPASWRTTLAAPPVASLGWTETLLGLLVPGLGGVHVVAARKWHGLAPAGQAETGFRWRWASAIPAIRR